MQVVFMMFFPLYSAPCSKTQVQVRSFKVSYINGFINFTSQEPVEEHELETKEPDSPLPAPQAAE